VTTHERIIAAIEQVAERLGPDLGVVVFVGATVAALYETAEPLSVTHSPLPTRPIREA
jgi:hypothetical protein